MIGGTQREITRCDVPTRGKNSIGSESFSEIPFITNKMCITIFEEMNFWQVKLKALAWSYNRAFGIFNGITDTHNIHV